MDRLKIVLFLATLIANAQTSVGQIQESASRGHATPSSVSPPVFAVIGDVADFNYFPISTDKPTTIHNAVMEAGLLSDTARVSVQRGNQEHALWTQMISKNSADSGEIVTAGDILVVQAMSALTSPAAENAALRIDSGFFVVSLSDESVAIGDVLHHTGQTLDARDQLKISCRFQGLPAVAKADVSHRVAHGDIVSLSRKPADNAKGFGRMAPVFSEWQSPSIPAYVPSPEPAFQSQAAPADASTLSLGQVASPASEPLDETGDTLEASLPDPPQSIGGFSFPETNQTSPLPLQAVSQSSEVPTVGSELEAPTPPKESRVAETMAPAAPAVNGSASLWNMLFIGVFLLSGSMIIIGALRGESDSQGNGLNASADDRQSSHQDPAPINTAVNSATNTAISRTIDERSMVSKESPATKTVEQPAAGSTYATSAISAIPRPKMLPETATSPRLVATEEWFDAGWKKSGGNIVQEREPVSPSVHAGGSGAVDASTEKPKPPVYLLEELVLSSLEETRGSVPVFAEKSNAAEKLIAAEVMSSLSLKSPESIAKEFSSAGSGSSINSQEASTDFEDLEELLQNRLPVDLCQTQLPLKISLFGRPAGPRRLRVDSSHSKLAGPHISMSAERRHEEPTAVTSGKPAAAAGGRDSLDRALHYLQDRTNS